MSCDLAVIIAAIRHFNRWQQIMQGTFLVFNFLEHYCVVSNTVRYNEIFHLIIVSLVIQ